MPDRCSWLNRACCCRQQSQPTYIYLYGSRMGDSSSNPLFRCLVCLIIVFCLAFVLLLTGVVIYHLNSDIPVIKSNPDQRALPPIAKRRQLPDFVNPDIDPCEHFYEFVCDKWIERKRLERYGEEYEHKWMRIRHRIHDTLMTNLTDNPSISNEGEFSSTRSAVHKLYQLCETQPRSLLLDELDRYFHLLIQLEPYRSYLTLYNQTNSIASTLIFPHNPFFRIIASSSSDHANQTYSTIVRIHPRPLPSPLETFPNPLILNQTALTHLMEFNKHYTRFLHEGNETIRFYEQEFNEDSLIIKRILSYSNYHLCLSSVNQSNGLQNLIELLGHFLRSRLRQYNTELMNKEIRILGNITDNHTLVENLRRIRLGFEMIEQIIPLDQQAIDKNTTCIINLLAKLIDKRFHINELPLNINLYSTGEYFISNDWPYLMMLYDRLLNRMSMDSLVNFVFFDSYRQLIYPYYQPHIHRLVQFENFTLSCPIQSCFDILNCYHPSVLNQLFDVDHQILRGSLSTIVENLINRFRMLIEQSDNLFPEEKKVLINQINQMKILIGHYSSSFTPVVDLNSSSYLEYARLFSSLSSDQQVHSYAIEPIYSSVNHTLFIPYGFIYLNNNSIEYPLMNFLLRIFSQTIQSSPFYIECLIKSFDDSNSTSMDFNAEHIIYLLFRSKFLTEENIILDEYLWPFMSANSLMKQFLINYTAHNYCQDAKTYQLYRNNTYLRDDVYLVFHCQQASSIKQSKCTVN